MSKKKGKSSKKQQKALDLEADEATSQISGAPKAKVRRPRDKDVISEVGSTGGGGIRKKKFDFDYDKFEKLGALEGFDDYGPLMELGVQEDPDKILEPNEEDEIAEMKGQLGERLSY